MERISQQTIDEIMNVADIVEVIGEYVQLQPAGKSYKGLCPFHNEKTPSFFVNKEKHLFNCFGCGEKGNAASFLMKYKNLTYIEALKNLADRYRIPLEIESTNNQLDKFNRYYEINRTALDYYQLALTHLETGKPALDYLKKRGIDIKTIQQFEIGFAPNDMDVLFKNLKTKYQELDLLDIGLVKKHQDGHYYDLFRNRIIFPIKNAQGKVIGFSGRIYQASETEPKYVNSPFTQIFTKGEVLYNLDKAIPIMKQMKRVVLYEGFMDVIASVRAGVNEAIATMGTALTIEQARLIKKHTDNIILCYDGDSAGFEAMMKAIQILENEKLMVNLVVLPEKLDPDEYVKKYSLEKYREYINTQQIDPFEFKYQYLRKHSDLKRAGGIERFKLSVFDLIKDTSATVSELYLRKLATDTSVDFQTVKTDYRDYQLSKVITKNQNEAKQKMIHIAISNKYVLAETALLNYYIDSPEYRAIIQNDLVGVFCADDLNREILLTIDDVLETSSHSPNLREVVLSRFKNEKLLKAELILKPKHDYTLIELDDCINQIKERNLLSEENAIREKQRQLDPLIDVDEYKKLSADVLSIRQRRENIWKKTKSSKN